MLIFLRVLGIIIIVLSVLLLIAVPPAGVVGIVIGALCVIRSCIKVSGKYKTNITQEDIDAAREDLHLSPGKILHLMYGDGSKRLSERDIEIQKIEKKGEDIYILAFCHLALDLRTFRKSRIISLTYEGRPVDDIKAFMSENASDLAKQASE